MKKIVLNALLLFSSALSFGQNCIPNTSSIQFSNSYVSFITNNGLDVTDSVSIEAWVYATSWGNTSAQNSIVCNHGWSSGEEGYVLRAGAGGILSFNIACDSAGTNVSWREVLSTPGSLQLNTWHHVAGTFSGTESKVYVDGVLVGTRTFGANVSIIPGVDYNLKIGRLADEFQPDNRYWNGRIDEVRIWHRVLSDQDIAQNMSHHIDPANVSDLAGYWRFNENQGTSITDLGTGNNTGTMTGGIWSADVPFTEGPAIPMITTVLPDLFSSSPVGNQWYLNGNPITGATNSSYQPVQNGTYTVVVTDSGGCSATSAAVIITTLGIIQAEPHSLLLKSNEISGMLIFNLSETTLRESDMKVYDNTGRLVIKLGKGNVQKEVSLNGIKPGVYFLSLKTPAGNFSEKIVVH